MDNFDRDCMPKNAKPNRFGRRCSYSRLFHKLFTLWWETNDARVTEWRIEVAEKEIAVNVCSQRNIAIFQYALLINIKCLLFKMKNWKQQQPKTKQKNEHKQ